MIAEEGVKAISILYLYMGRWNQKLHHYCMGSDDCESSTLTIPAKRVNGVKMLAPIEPIVAFKMSLQEPLTEFQKHQ